MDLLVPRFQRQLLARPVCGLGEVAARQGVVDQAGEGLPGQMIHVLRGHQ